MRGEGGGEATSVCVGGNTPTMGGWMVEGGLHAAGKMAAGHTFRAVILQLKLPSTQARGIRW